MAIPLIDFKQSAGSVPEVEIVELSRLYSRDFEDHDPQAPHRLSFFMLVLFEQDEQPIVISTMPGKPRAPRLLSQWIQVVN